MVINISEYIYSELTELLAIVKKMPGKSTLARPGLIEEMIVVYKQTHGIK